MKPQEPIPHNYSMAGLNKIFAIFSLLLLFVTGLMVAYDYIKGWKRFQLTFLRLQEDKIRADLRAARDSQDRGELNKIDEQVKETEQFIAANREEYRRAEDSLKEWEGRHYAADQDYRFTKATLDADRYETELAALQKRSGWEERQGGFQILQKRVEELKIELERVTRMRDAAIARVAVFRQRITDLEKKKTAMLADDERLSKQLKTVDAKDPAFMILNSPMLDFVSPTLKVDQIVLNDLFIDLNYMLAPRVDRCTTCHRAIDRPGFESREEAARLQAELEGKLDNFQIPTDRIADARARIAQLKLIATAKRNLRNPYRTHPNLDVFVGSASPHPLTDFGCTSCHRGLDRATEFARAGHSPRNAEQEHKWEKLYGWEHQPFLETPMHPAQHTKAACVKCHSSQMTVGESPDLTRAQTMIEFYGCHACHKIDTWRFRELRKPGPDLNGIAEKTTPQWALRWIADPHSFRPTTRMPATFYQRNMIGPQLSSAERDQNMRKQDAEIYAIVGYLWNKSSRRVWVGGAGGDATRGKQLVNSVGCMGCHIAQDSVRDEKGAVRVARRDDFPIERLVGFNLSGTGTKTNPAWVFNWLKDPRHYYEDAPMPDLRLTDQEASDITAYLMTLQKPQYMNKPVRGLDAATLAELTKSYLINTLSDRDANARLRSMSTREQLVYLGQRSIEKYGCYSCHALKGFETMKPIGTELTLEGSKNLHLFDFGFVHEYESWDNKQEHITHTVPSWIYNKLRSPRIYDDEREKTYHDKLKMPNYRLSQREAELITSVILGQTKARVSPQYLASMDPRHRSMEEGRKLISQHNCRACHVVEGYGRAIAQTIEDPGFLPPDLTPEGARVQSPWLFNFLKDPTVMTMRPWLKVRMPTFHFSDLEATRLVEGFAAEGQVPTFDTSRQIEPDRRSVEIGRAVFEMLRCAQCHPTGAVTAPSAQDAASLAPPLTLSRPRLQHDWIPDLIRRPNEMIPGTRMPTNFPRDPDTGQFTSPLAGAINTPTFSAYKARLMPYYSSEQELTKALGDVVQITNHLRDYIWTLGSPDMRTARPVVPGQVPRGGQRPSPPAPSLPAMKSSRLDRGSEAPSR